ncbi:MAG TPA: HemK/PrmC family methyltransferase [Candidatus Saccharimonadales bacterium]|nr:HemK/PrmC family methyltransferase [Candidatus Saccharimonadales bacterium]
MPTIGEWLKQSAERLKSAGISTARLDCLILLEDSIGHDRSWLLSHPEHELQGSVLKNLNTKIVQRATHVPLAYLRGKAEFYGRDFTVNEHTLVPRPETEAMINLLKRVRSMEADVAAFQVERRGRKPIKKQYKFEKQEPPSSLVKTTDGYQVVWQKPRRTAFTQAPAPIHGQSLRYHDDDFCIVDVGTGSGAIAITAKLEMPDATVVATDIDEHCLKTARQNAKTYDVDISFRRGDLLAALNESWLPANTIGVLLCNLPYVPDDFHINTAATHEPKHAIFGGTDGLDLYRRLFQQIAARQPSQQPLYILAEALPPSHKTLATIAKAAGYTFERTDDFIQLFERA